MGLTPQRLSILAKGHGTCPGSALDARLLGYVSARRLGDLSAGRLGVDAVRPQAAKLRDFGIAGTAGRSEPGQDGEVRRHRNPSAVAVQRGTTHLDPSGEGVEAAAGSALETAKQTGNVVKNGTIVSGIRLRHVFPPGSVTAGDRPTP